MEVRQGMSEVVLTVGSGHTLREAARRMAEREVGAAVVIDEELPGPGIVSERDILNSLGRGEDPDRELVRDHMRDTVISASPDWSLERAAVEMSKRGIRHLVVIERGELIGVLSMRDIVRVWTSEGATSGMEPPDG
jgi:CBS domain-containing protein